MTYRKLFLCLAVAGALVVALLGGLSVGTWTGISGSPASPTVPGVFGKNYVAGVSSGTLQLACLSIKPTHPHFNVHRWPQGAYRSDADFIRRKGFSHATSYTTGGPGEERDAFIVTMPLWFPYGVYLGLLFVLLKAMERRSVSGLEKELASRAGGGGMSSAEHLP